MPTQSSKKQQKRAKTTILTYLVMGGDGLPVGYRRSSVSKRLLDVFLLNQNLVPRKMPYEFLGAERRVYRLTV